MVVSNKDYCIQIVGTRSYAARKKESVNAQNHFRKSTPCWQIPTIATSYSKHIQFLSFNCTITSSGVII